MLFSRFSCFTFIIKNITTNSCYDSNPQNINDELRIATEAYLETDEALIVEEDRGVVHLSSLLRWYASDFGDTTEDILNWVHRNAAFPEKKEALQRVIESKKWKVQNIPYEWGTNENDV